MYEEQVNWNRWKDITSNVVVVLQIYTQNNCDVPVPESFCLCLINLIFLTSSDANKFMVEVLSG